MGGSILPSLLLVRGAQAPIIRVQLPSPKPCGADYTTEIKPLDEKSTASSTDAGRVAGRASRPDGGIGWVLASSGLDQHQPSFAWTKMNWIRRRNGGEFWTMSPSVRSLGSGTWTWAGYLGDQEFESRGQPYRRTNKTEKKPGKTSCSVVSDFSSTHDGERSWTDHARQRRIEVGLFFFLLPAPVGCCCWPSIDDLQWLLSKLSQWTDGWSTCRRGW